MDQEHHKDETLVKTTVRIPHGSILSFVEKRSLVS
jgi:hypothetical protein